jgi:hypothetical protein
MNPDPHSGAMPDSWDAVRSRVTALLARRRSVLDETAAAWVGFARSQGWTRADLDALWDGLTEDVVWRYGRDNPGEARVIRGDVLATMAELRERILGALGP